MKEDNLHIENVYAYNEDHKIIFIGDVPIHENGIKKGYYCLGCNRQMQAVKGNIRKQHFKHHVKPHSTEKKCTYRDETYRHKLAKELIQIVGKIKVPAVYKFDPDKKSNRALLIKESEFIDIKNVLIERHIYENENGEIEIIHHEDTAKKLLIKPDAIILDKDKKPKLIIEFVATHKPDIDKLIKLKRLGIDAIQISIPKSSPEEIEKCFSHTAHTKWLYNNEESKIDYVQFSNQYSGAIFEVDDEQRKLFEEGYKCRSSEIGDLIRTIERLLQTEHYQAIERNLRFEIQRVEANTGRVRERLDNLREGYIREGIEQHTERRGLLTSSKEEFSNYRAGLEKRYLKKRGELAHEEAEIDQSIAEIEFSVQKLNLKGSTTNSDIESARESAERIGKEIELLDRREESYSKIETENFERSKGEIESEIDGVRIKIETLSEYFERKGKELQLEFDRTTKRTEHEIDRIQFDQESISDSIRIESAIIGSRIKANNSELLSELEGSDNNTNGRFTQEHRKLHNFRGAIMVYKAALEQNDRIEDYFRKKT